MRRVFGVLALFAVALSAPSGAMAESPFDIFNGEGLAAGTSMFGVPSSGNLTANVQDPTRHPYQQRVFHTPNTCKADAQCVLFFPKITVSRTLIRHVSCWAGVTNGTTVQAIYLSNMVGQSNNPSMRRNYLPFSISSDGSNSYFTVNADTYLIVEPGKQPTVTFYLSAAAAVDCTISGYY